MPFERPNLPQLIDEGASEFESRLPGVLARVRRSLVGVINRVVAGGLSAVYKYAEYLDDQKWPDRSEGVHLDGHGARWKVPRTPAARATGTIQFTGVDGSVIPAATVVQRADGLQYETTAGGVIAAGAALVAGQAVIAGQAGNAAINTKLTLGSPVAGVNAAAKAYTEMSGGADVEDDEAYRSRILARIRKVPQGGAILDYVAWAKEVSGVTRAWVYPGEQGAGSVVLRFMRDDDVGGAIPSVGEVAAVQAHLDPLRPVTAGFFVVAPVASPLNFTIQLLPDTPAIRLAVEAELKDLIRREAIPGGTLLITHIREAISVAAGEADHLLTTPTANVVAASGQITTLGVITWV